MKKIMVLILTILFLIIPATSFAAFPDVPSDHWAVGYIDELTSKGVINGYPDGTYKPSDTLTYGQFLKLIVSASLTNVDFNLVNSSVEHWAAPYLKVAENYKAVAEDTIDEEALDKPISRIEVIKILSICDINMRNHQQQATASLDFKDIGNLSARDKVLLNHAVALKIINGYEDGTFRPSNNLTRAEAAKILSVYMNIK